MVGRPPKLYLNEDLPKMGEDLIKWLENEGRYQFMFEPWYFRIHGMFRKDWKELIQRETFRPYYEIARKIMASNMVMNKDVPQSYGNRYLGLYDDEVHHHEEDIRDKEAARKNLDEDSEAIKGTVSEMRDLLSTFLPKPSLENKASSEEHS